jgi:hypothetical protein
MGIMRVGVRFRAFALLAGAALALHQLRYLLAYGHNTETALGASGHAYFAVLTPIVLTLVALGFLQFGLRLHRARTHGATEGGMPTTGKLWASATLCLAAVYCAQELIEGQLAGGHAGGIAGVVGGGGWIAGILAFVMGGLIAVLLRGANHVIRVAAAHASTRPRNEAPFVLVASICDLPRLDTLACFQAGRGPPPTFA